MRHFIYYLGHFIGEVIHLTRRTYSPTYAYGYYRHLALAARRQEAVERAIAQFGYHTAYRDAR